MRYRTERHSVVPRRFDHQAFDPAAGLAIDQHRCLASSLDFRSFINFVFDN